MTETMLLWAAGIALGALGVKVWRIGAHGLRRLDMARESPLQDEARYGGLTGLGLEIVGNALMFLGLLVCCAGVGCILATFR